MDALNVSAIIVTRGDQELWRCIEPLQERTTFEEIIVWDNGAGEIKRCVRGEDDWEITTGHNAPDLSVYGRYAAIEHASGDLIYVQDDDCVVSDPQAIVDTWLRGANYGAKSSLRALDALVRWDGEWPRGGEVVVCNMPPEFRHDFYEDHALVGFGAAFHRDAPARAFARWDNSGAAPMVEGLATEMEWFRRTCDIVFTGLTPRVLVDVPYEDLPWAHYHDRMWKQPQHQAERARMRDLVSRIR